MKIVCVMPIYRRQRITLATIDLLKKQTLPLYEIVLIGSCGLDRDTAKKAGVDYIYHDNWPLGAKWQNGIMYAQQVYQPDAILINGSDAWITANWCEKMGKFIEEGYHLVGKKIQYKCKVNPNEKLVVLQRKQISRADPHGGGRLFSKTILDAMNWRLYPPHLNSSLDGESYKRTVRVAERDGINLRIKIADDITDAFVMEVKSSEWPSMNPWRKESSSVFGTKVIENPKVWLEKAFPDSLSIFKRLVPDTLI